MIGKEQLAARRWVFERFGVDEAEPRVDRLKAAIDSVANGTPARHDRNAIEGILARARWDME